MEVVHVPSAHMQVCSWYRQGPRGGHTPSLASLWPGCVDCVRLRQRRHSASWLPLIQLATYGPNTCQHARCAENSTSSAAVRGHRHLDCSRQ